MDSITTQEVIELLSLPRMGTYLKETGNDPDKALELYQWSSFVSAEMQRNIGYVEVIMRNAIDRQLKIYNANHGGDSWEWTRQGNTCRDLARLTGKKLNSAHRHAKFELEREVTHDDVIAQLDFGTWCHLFSAFGGFTTELDKQIRSRLWEQSLRYAFPNWDQSLKGRDKLFIALSRLRRTRNRVSHFDSILGINYRKFIDSLNLVLFAVDPRLPNFVMSNSQLRQLKRSRPV